MAGGELRARRASCPTSRRSRCPAYSQSLLAITPYVVGVYDNVAGDSDFDTGADIFWKPNGQFQLTATHQSRLRPGRERRPGGQLQRERNLLQRQAPVLHREPGLLRVRHAVATSASCSTRAASAARPTTAAAPATSPRRSRSTAASARPSTACSLAEEADDVGRSFCALRLSRDFDDQNLGVMVTQVERPFLDREATVVGIDHNWRPTRALEHPEPPDRQRHRRRRGAARPRGSGGSPRMRRLRDGQRLAPAVARHALRRRPADQRLRLPVAQQPQLRALAGRRTASPTCRRTRRTPRTTGAGASAAPTTTTAWTCSASSA